MNKIVFVCGCLEPGKNGVGDYVYRLAEGLVGKKIPVAILALHDGFIDNYLEQGFEQVPLLRISKSLGNRERTKIAKEWITRLDPDWISLQFVPYSFHRKGIPVSLIKILNSIGTGRKWHIMFHELWLGMDKGSSLKFKVIGRFQEFLINYLIRSLKPKAIHTHSPIYRSKLESLGFNIYPLPLFGNIRYYKPVEKKETPKSPQIAVFGHILPGAKFREFLVFLQTSEMPSPVFHFLGNNGSEVEKWVRLLDHQGMGYKVYGWLEEEALSRELSKCTIGVTSTPYNLIEKSGTVAAMLEHQLEVICIGAEWIPKGLKIEKSDCPVTRWDTSFNLGTLPGKSQFKGASLENVTNKFIAHLELI